MELNLRDGPRPQDVTVAVALAIPFAVYLVVLGVVAPPTEAEWAAADPILSIVPRPATLWLVPVAALILVAVWWRIAPPDRTALRRGAAGALVGAALAAGALGSIRLAAGETLPALVPPEESAAPGFLLSMTAGLEEELVCRAALLPALYFGLRGRVSGWARPCLAVVATGLAFAAWHALGESTVSATHFVTRFAVPGCMMSRVWLASPSAVVVGHATAHLFIPALFTAPGRG